MHIICSIKLNTQVLYNIYNIYYHRIQELWDQQESTDLTLKQTAGVNYATHSNNNSISINCGGKGYINQLFSINDKNTVNKEKRKYDRKVEMISHIQEMTRENAEEMHHLIVMRK